jgi:hypothetical protein
MKNKQENGLLNKSIFPWFENNLLNKNIQSIRWV